MIVKILLIKEAFIQICFLVDDGLIHETLTLQGIFEENYFRNLLRRDDQTRLHANF
jgi:hypothetical protein